MKKNKEDLLQKAETALIEFIIRVSKGNTTCETEVAVLPQVARLFFDLQG